MIQIVIGILLLFSISSEEIKGVEFLKGINEKKTESDIKKYLTSKDSKWDFNNTIIKHQAKRITRGCSTLLQKAKAIFNFVRDKIKYVQYNNSLRGALKTYTIKGGNCCDQTNLLVALCRAAKIPIRYVHGLNCYFLISKKTAGHVWAQILIDNVWYAADTTSKQNSLGVIKNWNTKKYNIESIKPLLSF